MERERESVCNDVTRARGIEYLVHHGLLAQSFSIFPLFIYLLLFGWFFFFQICFLLIGMNSGLKSGQLWDQLVLINHGVTCLFIFFLGFLFYFWLGSA